MQRRSFDMKSVTTRHAPMGRARRAARSRGCGGLKVGAKMPSSLPILACTNGVTKLNGLPWWHLIHPIDLSEFLQKLSITVIEAHDFAKLGAVTCFVLYNLAPDFDLPE
jgi:hypothetical protein